MKAEYIALWRRDHLKMGVGRIASRSPPFRKQPAVVTSLHRTGTVQVSDTGGASLATSQRITVADAPLYNLRTAALKPTEGIGTGAVLVANFFDLNPAAPTTDFTAVVNWGNGTSLTVSSSDFVSLGNGDFAVLADHLFSTSGAYKLSVQGGRRRRRQRLWQVQDRRDVNPLPGTSWAIPPPHLGTNRTSANLQRLQGTSPQTGCSAHRCILWSWFSSVRILSPSD
jgi:hypothetical protein